MFWIIILELTSIQKKISNSTPMKKLIKISILLASTFALVACCCNKNKCEVAYTPLFNKDLSNAIYDKAVWSIDNEGVLSANKDDIIFTKNDYQNFELEAEFKLEKKSNSGIIIYASDAKDWIPNSLEVQIADNTTKGFDKPYSRNATIYGHVDTMIDTTVSVGQWNKIKIRAVGQNIDIWLNGKHATKMNMAEFKDSKTTPTGYQIPPWLVKHKKCEMQTSGKIGFQGKHGKASTYYRNIKIRPVEKVCK